MDARQKMKHNCEGLHEPSCPTRLLCVCMGGASTETDALVAFIEEEEKGVLDVNAVGQDWRRQTALHWSIERGWLRLVEMLLDRGADVDKSSYCGRTPLFLSCQNGHLKLALLLAERGAGVEKNDLECFNCYDGDVFDEDNYCDGDVFYYEDGYHDEPYLGTFRLLGDLAYPKEDNVDAIKWWTLAAVEAISVGDSEEGVELMIKAAELGDLNSQANLGELYLTGNFDKYATGVEKNEKEAARWLNLAAAKGHVDAHYALDSALTNPGTVGCFLLYSGLSIVTAFLLRTVLKLLAPNYKKCTAAKARQRLAKQEAATQARKASERAAKLERMALDKEAKRKKEFEKKEQRVKEKEVRKEAKRKAMKAQQQKPSSVDEDTEKREEKQIKEKQASEEKLQLAKQEVENARQEAREVADRVKQLEKVNKRAAKENMNLKNLLDQANTEVLKANNIGTHTTLATTNPQLLEAELISLKRQLQEASEAYLEDWETQERHHAEELVRERQKASQELEQERQKVALVAHQRLSAQATELEEVRKRLALSESVSLSQRLATLEVDSLSLDDLMLVQDLAKCCAKEQVRQEMRNEMMARVKQEVEKEAKKAQEVRLCSICFEREVNLVFDCGHEVCEPCGKAIKVCHICRNPIATRIKFFS